MALGKNISWGSGKKPVYPTKKRINFVVNNETERHTVRTLLLFLIFLALLTVFSKFAIVDPLMGSMQGGVELTQAKERLAALEASNGGMNELSEKYTRYIVPNLTEEEQNLVDREEILDLLKERILTVAHLSSVKVSQNTVSITCISVDLAQVSGLVESLEADPRVSHVTVSTAQSSDGKSSSATINVELKGALSDAQAPAGASGENSPAAVAGSGASGVAAAASASPSVTKGVEDGR